jgi:hypothetical protein
MEAKPRVADAFDRVRRLGALRLFERPVEGFATFFFTFSDCLPRFGLAGLGIVNSLLGHLLMGL